MKNMKFCEYQMGKLLAEQFSGKEVPLLLMQHLRQMDFPITRGISYERTVDEFLKQLAVNDVLRPLRLHDNLVILLDAQGALLKQNGKWVLLFTPGLSEQMTINEDAPLLPVLAQLFELEKKDRSAE